MQDRERGQRHQQRRRRPVHDPGSAVEQQLAAAGGLRRGQRADRGQAADGRRAHPGPPAQPQPGPDRPQRGDDPGVGQEQRIGERDADQQQRHRRRLLAEAGQRAGHQRGQDHGAGQAGQLVGVAAGQHGHRVAEDQPGGDQTQHRQQAGGGGTRPGDAARRPQDREGEQQVGADEQPHHHVDGGRGRGVVPGRAHEPVQHRVAEVQALGVVGDAGQLGVRHERAQRLRPHEEVAPGPADDVEQQVVPGDVLTRQGQAEPAAEVADGIRDEGHQRDRADREGEECVFPHLGHFRLFRQPVGGGGHQYQYRQRNAGDQCRVQVAGPQRDREPEDAGRAEQLRTGGHHPVDQRDPAALDGHGAGEHQHRQHEVQPQRMSRQRDEPGECERRRHTAVFRITNTLRIHRGHRRCTCRRDVTISRCPGTVQKASGAGLHYGR